MPVSLNAIGVSELLEGEVSWKVIPLKPSYTRRRGLVSRVSSCLSANAPLDSKRVSGVEPSSRLAEELP